MNLVFCWLHHNRSFKTEHNSLWIWNWTNSSGFHGGRWGVDSSCVCRKRRKTHCWIYFVCATRALHTHSVFAPLVINPKNALACQCQWKYLLISTIVFFPNSLYASCCVSGTENTSIEIKAHTTMKSSEWQQLPKQKTARKTYHPIKVTAKHWFCSRARAKNPTKNKTSQQRINS